MPRPERVTQPSPADLLAEDTASLPPAKPPRAQDRRTFQLTRPPLRARNEPPPARRNEVREVDGGWYRLAQYRAVEIQARGGLSSTVAGAR